MFGIVIAIIVTAVVAYFIHKLTLPGLIADAKAEAAKEIGSANQVISKVEADAKKL